MAADRSMTPGIGHNQPCALCAGGGAPDAAFIEQVAADLWESRRDGHLCDWPWNEASDHWQRIFRDFAATAIASVRAHAQNAA